MSGDRGKDIWSIFVGCLAIFGIAVTTFAIVVGAHFVIKYW